MFSTEFWITIVLTGCVVTQQIFFMRQVQKLIDKLMSRNYGDYKISESYKTEEKKPEFKVEQEPDDLRALQEFQI